MNKGIVLAYERFIQRLDMYGYKLNMPIEWFILFGKKTQAQMVFWHLEKYGTITRDEATFIYGVGHQPSVIRDLRDMFREQHAPFEITNKSTEGINMWGKNTIYDVYTFGRIKDEQGHRTLPDLPVL